MSGRVRGLGQRQPGGGGDCARRLVVVEGDASARCGISLKGGDIVVKGSIGHMSAFMAQTGRIVCLGDAGDALGRLDLRGALYVRGSRQEPRRGLRREGAGRRARRRAGASSWRRAGVEGVEAGGVSPIRLGRQAVHSSTSTTRGATSDGMRNPTARRLARERLYDRTRSPRSSARPARASTTSAASARSASCRTSTTCCSWARACRATRWRATASAATPTSRWARGMRRNRSS